jgi:hypothetical protein
MTSGGNARYSRPSPPRTQGFPGTRAILCGARNLRRAGLPNYFLFAKESPMKKVFAALVATVFALSSASVLACAGDKAKDEKQMSTPSKPKI